MSDGDCSSSSYESIEDVITVSSYEDVERQDDSSYETIEEEMPSEYETIEEEVVVSDYVTDDEDVKSNRKAKPSAPPLAEADPESQSKPAKKTLKKEKGASKSKSEPPAEISAPPIRKHPSNDMGPQDEQDEESDTQSDPSSAKDDSDDDDSDRMHKAKPKKKSDVWDPNPEDAPASPTNNEKPVERLNWSSNDYYRGDTECFNAWRKFRPEKAKRKKRIERIEIVSKRVKTKPRRIEKVHKKKEKPPQIIRVRHTRQVVQKTRVRKVKEKPPPIAHKKNKGPKDTESKKMEMNDTQLNDGKAKIEKMTTNKSMPKESTKKNKETSKTQTQVPADIESLHKPAAASGAATPRIPPKPVNAKDEIETPPSPPETPKKFGDLVASFSKGQAQISPLKTPFKKSQKNGSPVSEEPEKSQKRAQMPNQSKETISESKAEVKVEKPCPVKSNALPRKTEAQRNIPEKEKMPTHTAASLPKAEAPKLKPKSKTKPPAQVSGDESSMSSFSSGSDSEDEAVPVVRKKKNPDPPKDTFKPLPEIEEPKNLQRASTSQVYTSLIIKDCEKEPTMAEYQRLADVTEKYFTRYLKREYKNLFYDVKVSVKKTKFNCGIPSPDYNVYVQWDVKARFCDGTGNLRDSSSHINSTSDIPSDYQLLRTIVNSLDMAYLDKIANLKKTPFGRSRGIFMEEVVGKTLS
jgi:hypothetical protein